MAEHSRGRQLVLMATRPRYHVAKILEIDKIITVKDDDTKSTGEKNVVIVKHDGKEYHAVIFDSGDFTNMESTREKLEHYENKISQLRILGSANQGVQTEPTDIGEEGMTEENKTFVQLGVRSAIETLLGNDEFNFEEGNFVDDVIQDNKEEEIDLTRPSTSRSHDVGVPWHADQFSTGLLEEDLISLGVGHQENPLPTTAEDVSASDEPQLERHADLDDPLQCIRESPRAKDILGKKASKTTRKRHFCKFCKKMIANFARHLINTHNSESEVISFKNTKNKAERNFFLRKIMAEGDALYNKQHPKSPIVRRKSKSTTVETRDKCPNCKMLVSKKHAVSHLRKCSSLAVEIVGKEIRVDLIREKILDNEQLNEQMKRDIIPQMRNDKITKLCQEDNSLILYGNKLCERLHGEGQEKTIRNHLRIVARISSKVMEKDESITKVQEIFTAKKYDLFVQAIHEVCGHGQAEGGEMKKPTTPHQYGPKMRELSDYVITSFLKQKDPNNEQDELQEEIEKKIKTIQGWQEIYDRDFDKQVASLGRKQADRRTFTARQQTPSMEDVQKLISFVETETEESFKRLKENFSLADYYKLSQCLLLRIWIFNRKRVGEVDRLRLNNWLNAKEIDENSDQFKSLSATEQSFASSFKRLVVQGKLRRPVPLLVPKKDSERFDLIIKLREKAGVSENMYLFARSNNRYIEGTAVMADFAKKSGAKDHKLLTGTRLRKQLAAALRYLNLSDEDLRMVAEAMGHKEKTHLVHYRQYDAALHAGRVSKILMAMDDGTIQRYQGKSLEEIDNAVVVEAIPPNEDLINVDYDPVDRIDEHHHETLPSCSSGTEMASETQDETEFHSLSVIREQQVTPQKKRNLEKNNADSGSEYNPSSDDEDSCKETRGNTPGRKRVFRERKKHKKTKWSREIKDALKAHLATELEQNKCPSTSRILHAMEALQNTFPEILEHSPKKVKALVSNMARQTKK